MTAAITLLFPNIVFAAEGVPLTLDEAIALALKNNRLIEQSTEDREAARWNLSAVRRSSGLTFSWSSSLNRIGGRAYNNYRARHYEAKYESQFFDVNTKLYPSYMSENYNSFNLQMPLYTGGRLENQRKTARYALNAADMTLEDSRQTVKYQAAAAYYQVLQR